MQFSLLLALLLLNFRSNEQHYFVTVWTVHGKEYGFGAHDFPASGVFEVEPRSCPGFIYRSSIVLGHITMPPTEFRTFVENAASEYHGDTYHLISKNCNHFTDDISWRLTGKHIPGWVNRLARLGIMHFTLTNLPFLFLFLFLWWGRRGGGGGCWWGVDQPEWMLQIIS